MQAPVAQQLYSSTRSMPFQEEAAARGGAAFDSSFGCTLDMDSLHWNRARGMDSTEDSCLGRASRCAVSDIEMCSSEQVQRMFERDGSPRRTLVRTSATTTWMRGTR